MRLLGAAPKGWSVHQARSVDRHRRSRPVAAALAFATVTVTASVVAQSASGAGAWAPLRAVTGDAPVAIGAFSSNDGGSAIAAWVGADRQVGSVFAATRDPQGGWRTEPVRT